MSFGSVPRGHGEGAQVDGCSLADLLNAPVRLAEDLLQPSREALKDGFDLLCIAFRCRKAHRSVIGC